MVTEANLFNSYLGEPDKLRFVSAMRREPVDRVPNFEVLIEDRHVEKILGKYAGNTLAIGGDPAKGAGQEGRPMYPDDYIDICNIIGQDIMSMDAGLWTPFKKYDLSGKLIQVSDKSVKNRKDFNELILDSEDQINNTVKYVKEYKDAIKRRNSKIGIMPAYGCIMQTLYEFVVGMNDFMMLAYEEPELIEEMLEVSANHFEKMTVELVKTGTDAIELGDDVAFKSGLFLPPKIMREFWVPKLGKIIKPAVDAGIPVMFHSDGKVDDIVEDLINIGVNVLNPLDPYSVDYREYKKKFGSRIAFSGNIDIEFPLSNGTPEDIESDVKAHMEIMKPGYGYIATCSHSIVNYIPHENFIAYINAIHEYGKY